MVLNSHTLRRQIRLLFSSNKAAQIRRTKFNKKKIKNEDLHIENKIFEPGKIRNIPATDAPDLTLPPSAFLLINREKLIGFCSNALVLTIWLAAAACDLLVRLASIRFDTCKVSVMNFWAFHVSMAMGDFMRMKDGPTALLYVKEIRGLRFFHHFLSVQILMIVWWRETADLWMDYGFLSASSVYIYIYLKNLVFLYNCVFLWWRFLFLFYFLSISLSLSLC